MLLMHLHAYLVDNLQPAEYLCVVLQLQAQCSQEEMTSPVRWQRQGSDSFQVLT
jgi:hypothetical protein